jgi:hypothetical protein
MNDLKKRVVNLQKGIFEFAKLERILAVVCVFIPLILIIVDQGNIRESISNYAYMNHNHVYVFLLTLAAMMFVVNGTIKHKNWYNVVLGIALAGIVLFPHLEFKIVHYVFATIFFLGSVIVISFYTSKKQFWIACGIAVVIVLSLLAHFWLHWFSLFIAEWIALGIIGIHYILESFKILD